ncbi:MAG: hypothetical protein ACYTFK_01305 [Planctomycetota bacterium]|jgi:hypothetical protein
MKTTLDEIIEFEQTELAVASWEWASIERSAAGVDGAVKVDLGRRTRQIVQKGILRAPGREALSAKVDFVCDMAGGASHTVETTDGQRFENLWIDLFKTSSIEYSGRGASCEFEIRYVQL